MIDELNKRIIEVMVRSEHSKSTFAKVLDVSLPLITHITTGRNKPGLDIIQKVLMHFERINPDWLLLGVGKMYREEPAKHDFSAIIAHIEQLASEIEAIQLTHSTVIQYHKILLDEIKYLSEMDTMLESGTSKLHELTRKLEGIKRDIKSIQ